MYLWNSPSGRTCWLSADLEVRDHSCDHVDEVFESVWYKTLGDMIVTTTHLALPLPAPPSDSELTSATSCEFLSRRACPLAFGYCFLGGSSSVSDTDSEEDSSYALGLW